MKFAFILWFCLSSIQMYKFYLTMDSLWSCHTNHICAWRTSSAMVTWCSTVRGLVCIRVQEYSRFFKSCIILICRVAWLCSTTHVLYCDSLIKDCHRHYISPSAVSQTITSGRSSAYSFHSFLESCVIIWCLELQ